ncbi:MAG: cyclodeaminase/cyclohydrolase family protein [Candidatus Omnitrophica bacterium]|nr:cyclodeaminase/cyclohydrolase family protein [Candidatus Omnitrophota bacterium]MCF7892137.1 cyclodeaminase/cyclohydrolase family protein [Candidatus Omnitrophota bacterium]MCF7897498.1 cyclodeaminase/cyclohydrolase family protein [Candidatus Omnitrophota bacterium]MCF7909279.1 cyclodeaminase/cyclohydrolase family protein [Candidatus Omnitrophota bacterium]
MITKNYRKQIKPYLDDLAKKRLAPGGGSAGALAFCLGCSLIAKSINHTKNKEMPKVKERKLTNRLDKILNLKKKVYPYIDRDGRLFSQMIKSGGQERQRYLKEMTCLLKDLAQSSDTVISLAKELDFDIKKSIKSDFYLGLQFIRVSLESVIFNLEANSNQKKGKDKYLQNLKNVSKKIKIR